MRRHHLLICLLGATSLLGACMRPATIAPAASTAPYRDVSLRLAVSEPTAGYTPAVGDDGQPLYLYQQPAITSSDISRVSKAQDTNGVPSIQIDFKPEAQERIRDFTSGNVGKRVSLLAGDKVLTTATVQGVFSESMWLTGISRQEQQQRFIALTRGPTDAAPDEPSAAD